MIALAFALALLAPSPASEPSPSPAPERAPEGGEAPSVAPAERSEPSEPTLEEEPPPESPPASEAEREDPDDDESDDALETEAEPAEAEPETEPIPVPAAEDPLEPVPLNAGRFVPGSGFEMKSENGRHKLQIRARLQTRYDVEIPHAEGEELEQVLQVRRARLQLQGHVYGEHNRYYIQFGFSPRDMTGGLVAGEGSIRRNPLRDARLEFDYLRDFTVWVGQMKVPFSRQRVTSSGDQQMVDRSLANEVFNLDRDLGIQARSQDLGGLGGYLGYQAGVFMGDGRNAFELATPGLLYVARVEVRPLGAFADGDEPDLVRTPRPRFVLAGAYAYHDDAPGDRGVHGSVPADGGTTDLHHATADLLGKWKGLSVQGAFHWRKARRRNPGDAVDDMGMPIPVAAPLDAVGWLGQVGWLVPRIDLELVGRYSGVRRLGDQSGELAFRDELGGGVGYYFFRHGLKLQLDYFRLWNAGLGATPGEAIGNGTDRVRLQLQLAF
jgi:phosphate-selective porin OprO/OprP